jgi:transposase
VTLEKMVGDSSLEGSMVYTDEWRSHDHFTEMGRDHATVCYAIHEWAREDDGICEVHDNTLEGKCTGLRNNFPIFRGVSKKYLH